MFIWFGVVLLNACWVIVYCYLFYCGGLAVCFCVVCVTLFKLLFDCLCFNFVLFGLRLLVVICLLAILCCLMLLFWFDFVNSVVL